MLNLFKKTLSQTKFKVLKVQKAGINYNFGGCSKDFVNFKPDQVNLMKTAPKNLGKPTLVPTHQREKFTESHKSCGKCHGSTTCGDWKRDMQVMSVQQAVREAQRCLKCVDAPCQKGCSTNIDIKTFIYQIENQNWYGAAKTILSSNPLGLSCGMLCPISELCASDCNMNESQEGSIKINRLQETAVRIFKEMKVPQVRHPSIQNLPASYQQKIAIIGCGAAGVGCATFLGRMGYDNVHVFERESYGGGLVTNEIPQNRALQPDIDFEVEQMKQLGVQVFYNQEFGRDGFNIDSLKRDGYKAIFLGTGLQEPKMGLGPEIYNLQNCWNSQNFLRPVVLNSKGVESHPPIQMNGGHAVVIGIGDTAIDCARSAFRLGAQRVTVVFRRGFSDMRANEQAFQPAYLDMCNFIPYAQPTKVDSKDGKVTRLHLQYNLPTSNDPKAPNYKHTNDTFSIDCDYLITAFGCESTEKWHRELSNKKTGNLDVNLDTMQTKSQPWIFAGGDAVGSGNLVDAVNDGKTASWYLHKYIQGLHGLSVPSTPQLPEYHTPIDFVDLSVDVCGVQFPNPFGLASAPPTTSYPMIKRAFQEGWGFALTKTFALDKDLPLNVSPRIYQGTAGTNINDASFANIELITEQTCEYWLEGSKQIQKEFPDRVLIGSIMCAYKQEDWVQLTQLCNQRAHFDMLELNLSCPHGMNEKGMGRACGEDPEIVQEITRWVVGVSQIPVSIKISPNPGFIEDIAMAAQRGGAHAVTLTNTFPSMMDPAPDGTPWPKVSEQENFTFGGAAGSVLRPIALRKLVECVTHKGFNLPVLGTGGIVGPDHAIAWLRYGASVLQVCSAVQNLDAGTVAYDLQTGLQAHIYLNQLQARKDDGWRGQRPPFHFDQLSSKDEGGSAKGNNANNNNNSNNSNNNNNNNNKPISETTPNIPKIKDIVGQSLHHLSPIDQMTREYVIPQIDQSICVKCGRCYLACADSGYQAIDFPSFEQNPVIVEKDCTGCALCHAVCPVPGSITMVPRKSPFQIDRGTTPSPETPSEVLVTVPPRHERLRK